MRMRRPEAMTVGQWLLKDLSLKTIIVSVLAVSAFAWRHSSQLTVVSAKTDQRFVEEDRRDDEMQKRLDAQRDAIKAKVDKDTYEAEQARLSEQLQGIQLSLNTIQAALMHPPK